MNAPGSRFLGLSTASKSSDNSLCTYSFGEGMTGKGMHLCAMKRSGFGYEGAEMFH
jgi:hypothetical protein